MILASNGVDDPEVREAIATHNPDIVAVELDENRFKALTDKKRFEDASGTVEQWLMHEVDAPSRGHARGALGLVAVGADEIRERPDDAVAESLPLREQ